jgi:hypothetical protein
MGGALTGMGKREQYVKHLRPLLASETGAAELEDFLVSNSNLPGPRGNLELAFALADCFEAPEAGKRHLGLLWRWSAISPREAGVNDPRSFLTFCAIVCLGAWCLNATEGIRDGIIAAVKAAASDPRWRIREASAMAFQRIAEKDFKTVRDVFSSWVKTATLMEMRAIEAALAHPPILNVRETADFCFEITDQILTHIESLPADERRSEEFRVLKKGLEYTISVFAAAAPEKGFPFLRRWGWSDDADIAGIVRRNLAKSRLARRYPREVLEVQDAIAGSGP